MRFGVAVPTCVEGMVYPIPFGDHTDILEIAREAEELGFDSILANDHLSTQRYVRNSFATPPRYYEPLTTLGWLAASTTSIRLMTGVIVLPLRDPVLLAKQVATVDQLSGGRLTLGVGVGGYREEYESVRPQMKDVRRSVLVEEGLEALRMLFEERVASFNGESVAFSDVEMYPKPVQAPLPIYSSGNADGTLRRAARFCEGWMPAGMPFERLSEMLTTFRQYVAEAGRQFEELAVAPQYVMSIGDSEEEAADRFRRSQVFEHLVSLRQSTLKDQEVDAFVRSNLIGQPDEIIARINSLSAIGVSELAGLIVVADTPAEMIDQMRLFAHHILPAFPRPSGSAT